MKTLRAIKFSPEHGKIEVIIRIDGHLIYMKSSSQDYVKSITDKMKQMGAAVVLSNDRKYFRINIFAKEPFAKIKDKEINIEKDSPQEIEGYLAEFYKLKYAEAGFSVEIIDG